MSARMQPGKVYLVGAGPGHPELLTVKAAELIKTGDVIVYDRLIQEEVLALARPSAERIYMGKPVGRHESRQDEIHELLVRYALEGKTVVRLKGGDPFVFGRGGEEAEYLASHGIPFEVIPGVCSALSAPASAGIAVTHRDAASSVAIVTGHNATSAEDRIDWNAIARVDTLVFLMAVHNVGKIAAKLIANGRSPQTPAAMVQMAYWHDERVVSGTLQDIADRVHEARISPPATLVVGEVVRLREKLACAQRDLRRHASANPLFQPAPGMNQLLRIASGGIGTQVLGWALEKNLLDLLEEPRTSYDLAHSLGLNAEALSEILRALVSLGLLESRPEGYRNLELASRYLVSASPLSLRDLLLYNCSQLVHWQALSDFAERGRTSANAGRDGNLHRAACEAAARFTSAAVVEKLAMPPRFEALVVGWGSAALREAMLRRWPEARVTARNPWRGEALGDADCDLLLLSGVLESGDTDGIEQIFRYAASHLRDGGQLVIQDNVLHLAVVPAPEVALAALARHVLNRECHAWSQERVSALLQRHGFVPARYDSVLAGQVMILATRVQSGALAAAAD
jgi:uroporphyrin-III C-methyltransferase